MTYADAVAALSALAPRGWRLGLDRMEEFVRLAGLAQAVSGKGPRYLHIAGTNGKGSVTAFVQSLCVEHGFRTGAFFSPYVVDLRERVQFGRDLISQEDFARSTEELLAVGETLTETEFGGITEFEMKTAIGFKYWWEKGCDWVALEVGLGGRLDATNVVRPAACAIVSIGLDHCDILGHSLAEIAAEKAGIIKPGIPVVIGRLPDEAESVVRRTAAEAGSTLWTFGSDFAAHAETRTIVLPNQCFTVDRLGFEGPIQWQNAAIAVMTCHAAGIPLEQTAVTQGLARAAAPGRFQRVQSRGKEWIVDGAHNAEATAELVSAIQTVFGSGTRLRVVFGMVRGHDAARLLSFLAPVVDHMELVPIDYHRSMAVADLAEIAKANGLSCRLHQSLDEGLAAAADADSPILVTGSFYLAGEALRALT